MGISHLQPNPSRNQPKKPDFWLQKTCSPGLTGFWLFLQAWAFVDRNVPTLSRSCLLTWIDRAMKFCTQVEHNFSILLNTCFVIYDLSKLYGTVSKLCIFQVFQKSQFPSSSISVQNSFSSTLRIQFASINSF